MKEMGIQVLELMMILVTVSSLFLWSHSESRNYTRRIEELISAMHQETYQEMKDFHGRLAGIEAHRISKDSLQKGD